jgi:glycosyltransferase involved in cell wall biosynthesis
MLLSICIPTYNRPENLKNCLDSIAKQVSTDFEVCISDNASKADIGKIIQPFKKKFKIRFKRNKKNLGFAMNVLNVSLMARGRFIWFLGDDDLLTKNSLSFLIKLIKKNKKINFFWINSYYLDVSYLKKFSKKFDINFLPKNLKTHSPQKKDRILNFFDLIDHRICFDYLLGIYVNCFNRKLWLENLHVCNLKNMKDKRVWSNFDNTAFFIKVFCEAFSNSKAYLCSKPLSVNLSGVREWTDLYPLVEIVRLPEALDYYRSKGLSFFQYIYTKNYSMRNFFNFFFKILITGDKAGISYINFTRHFLKNLVYPYAWLSIIFFVIRKSKIKLKKIFK